VAHLPPAHRQNKKNKAMADPLHPTNPEWELFDPEVEKPPVGVTLVLLNEGGTMIVGPWYPGAQAWGYKPKVPASVKARIRARLQKQKQENESKYATQLESGSPDPA